MCLAMNPDKLAPGERCASTSNRNFEGRQGRGGRTHLVSPAVAAATAIAGHFASPDRPGLHGATDGNRHIVRAPRCPLDRSDVDTDQIIPADWLKRVERTGFGKGLFAAWRDDRDFVLNQRAVRRRHHPRGRAQLRHRLVREHAVWAIMDYGFQAVISPRFADIFRNNCTKNGLVPVVVRAEVGEQLLRADRGRPHARDHHRRRAPHASRRPAIGLDGRRSRSTTPSSSGSCRASTTSASRCATRADIDRFERNRPAWMPTTS